MPLQFLKLVLLLATILFSSFIIFTRQYALLPITTILISFCFLVLGIEQRAKAQGNGFLYFLSAVALLAFSIYRIVTSA